MSARTRGFTLVELMVSLAVGGLVVAAGHAVLQTTIDAAARSRAAREPALAAATARLMLTDWLRSAAVIEGAGSFRVIHRAGVGAHLDELAFAVHHGGHLYPGPHRIRLWVDRSSTSPRRGLLAEVIPLGGDHASADTLEVAPEVMNLGIRVLILSDARERWVREWESVAEPPLAIELRLAGPTHVTLGAAPPPESLSPILALPIVAQVAVKAW